MYHVLNSFLFFTILILTSAYVFCLPLKRFCSIEIRNRSVPPMTYHVFCSLLQYLDSEQVGPALDLSCVLVTFQHLDSEQQVSPSHDVCVLLTFAVSR